MDGFDADDRIDHSLEEPVKCSGCSAQILPVVALDIDGTLGDYHSHIYDFACAYLGEHPSLGSPYGADGPPWFDGSINFGSWIQQVFEIDRRIYRDIKLAYRQGAQKRSMPVFPGARDIARAAHAIGAEVWIATSRPYLRLDNIDPDTRHWLSRHEVGYDHAIYSEEKYNELAKLVTPERVCFVLDDLGDMYDQAAANFGDAVPTLRRTFWNRGVWRPRVVEDLGAALLMLRAHVEDWYIKHSVPDYPPTTN
jgi:FMN phosphatase YigB (HAD superfamily)